MQFKRKNPAAPQGPLNPPLSTQPYMAQQTPYGAVNYSHDAQTNAPLKTVTLTPELQQQLDQKNALALTLGEKAMKMAGQVNDAPFSMEGLPQLSADHSADTARAEKNHFERSMSLLKPLLEDQQKSMRVELAGRGIPMGSEAYTKAMQDLGGRQKELLTKLAYDAVSAGAAEQSRLFNQERASRQQALSEKTLERQMPISELSALAGHSAVQLPDMRIEQGPYMRPSSGLESGSGYDEIVKAELAVQREKDRRKATELKGLFGLGKMFLGL